MLKLFEWESLKPLSMWLLICVIINEMITPSPSRGLKSQACVRSNRIVNCTVLCETVGDAACHLQPFLF